VAKIVDLTLGKYIIRHAEKVICISKAGKTWVSETFGCEDIEVIYRGFDFPNIERKVNEIPKIGFVGRLTGLKNVD
jgi:glycosyltransferase involved in cell wall biosynthesis